MVIVLGDLLVDISLRLPDMSSQPKDLHELTSVDLGPGGAGNVAIMAARLGLEVSCLGEVGDDLFGRIVSDGLAREGIDSANMVVTAGARTPVATVLVDDRAEPAYLGYPGSLQLAQMPAAWRQKLKLASALYSDGWAEHDGVSEMILEAFQLAQESDVPIFFDPGPGNPRIDNTWHKEAGAMATVLLATEEEALRLSGEADPVAAGRLLREMGPQLVIIKRGAAGCFLQADDTIEISAGFPVTVRDTTGAGDGFDAAIIHGYLGNMSLEEMAILANATGAAKVEKLGTGQNMPALDEVKEMLARFGHRARDFGLH